MFAVDDLDDTVARLRAHGANPSARWSGTRTSTGCATCAALRASSSRWPRSFPEAFTASRDRVAPRCPFDLPGNATHSPTCLRRRMGPCQPQCKYPYSATSSSVMPSAWAMCCQRPSVRHSW
jgi:hypothetical protein